MGSASEIVRKCYRAYESKDRKALEELLSDDFTFSSPVDDRIDRQLYFERCWPNSAHQESFHITKLFEQGNEVFVTYECHRKDGGTFRNTEFFQLEDGRIKHVEVYFGSDTGEAVNEEEIRALMDRIATACRAKDRAALIANYATDVVAFDLLDPLRYEGSEAVGDRAEAWFSSFEGSFDYETKDLKIAAASEVAFCDSLNHVNGKKTDGQKIDMWWRATICAQKLGGQWKVTHAHNSVPFDMNTGKASLDIKPPE
jgi:ketosteroid isomerase-like protein